MATVAQCLASLVSESLHPGSQVRPVRVEFTALTSLTTVVHLDLLVGKWSPTYWRVSFSFSPANENKFHNRPGFGIGNVASFQPDHLQKLVIL